MYQLQTEKLSPRLHRLRKANKKHTEIQIHAPLAVTQNTAVMCTSAVRALTPLKVTTNLGFKSNRQDAPVNECACVEVPADANERTVRESDTVLGHCDNKGKQHIQRCPTKKEAAAKGEGGGHTHTSEGAHRRYTYRA